MASGDKFFYTLVSKEFYESFDAHKPNLTAFYHPLERILPQGWEIVRNGVWFHCRPPESSLPLQGWKIHLSATFANAAAVLTTAARILFQRNIPFKFALDWAIFYVLNGKRWPRGGTGKFITVYPKTDDEFKVTIEELYCALIGFAGPYVLSDRRYKDSGVVHYRYGGLVPVSRLDITGDRSLVMQAPDGSDLKDSRPPYFFVPDWTQDPFTDADQSVEDGTLKNGRYLINAAIAFSNTGGVYAATDTHTGQQVIIKEARPFTNQSPNGTEAVALLKKEHRLLTILEETGVAPKPIDFFKDWEHYYLVQERVGGIMLRLYAMQHDLALRTRPTIQDVREFYAKYCALYGRIARVLETLHRHNIVFTDISFNNILVDQGGEKITFIDFEAAHEIGVDSPTLVYTPGFASGERADGRDAEYGDDYFGFGALLVAGLMPVNVLLTLDAGACDRFLKSLSRDLGLPDSIGKVVLALTAAQRTERISPGRAIEILESGPAFHEPFISSEEASIPECESVVQRAVDYIVAQANFERQDRLFPCDPKTFNLNPLNLAYGACGIAYALHKVTGQVSEKITDWILDKPCTPDNYPPGLYTGMSGIAWALLEMGLTAEAIKICQASHSHPLLYELPDLMYGLTGWGMTQLRFFLATQDQLFLEKAIQAGKYLIQIRQKDDASCWWPSLDRVHSGLAHGGSGISLFLLYLYLITEDEEFLRIGESALDFVVQKGVRNKDGGITWRLNEKSDTVTPYWRYGSVGVGTAVLRYFVVTRREKYKGVLDDIIVDADRKYAIFPSLFFGLAGLGEFFLDLARYDPKNESHKHCARKAAAGVLLFKLSRETGIAFPGEQLMRISCDYATGSAGIMLFLHRLMHLGQPSFLLDELLSRRDSHITSASEVMAACVGI